MAERFITARSLGPVEAARPLGPEEAARSLGPEKAEVVATAFRRPFR